MGLDKNYLLDLEI